MNNQETYQFPFQHFMINPWTDWEKFFNPQFFITYNYEDAKVENHVLRGVGSYGKQLGLILDVLSVLVSRLPQNDLTPQERLVLDRFQHLFRGVKAAVADHQGPQNDDITQGDIDRVADGLRSLARSDAETYRRLVGRLLGAINTEHAEQR